MGKIENKSIISLKRSPKKVDEILRKAIELKLVGSLLRDRIQKML